MVLKRDYTLDAVNAARSVLLEVAHLLGEYSEDIVIVGGWVPDLILPVEGVEHIGSIDVDVALNHRTQKVQDIRPRKARGVDLAFELPIKVTIQGTLPGGGEDIVKVNVASVAPFIIMKGMALESRLKEKDAWDIYYCVRYFPGGEEALVQEFLPTLDHGLVQEGLRKIAEKFSFPKAVGPTHVADFEELTDLSERELIQRDAYERIDQLLRRLDIV